MDWPKVKTVLIITLLAVDLFLFGAYANSMLKQSRNEAQVRSEICSVLKDLGYELNPALLPADSELYYPARITRRPKSEQAIMAGALEQVSVENAVGVTKYTGRKGEVTIRSGGYFDAIYDLSDHREEDAVSMAESKLKGIKISIMNTELRDENGVQVVGGICAAAGKPIFNCRVECRISGDNMAVSGRIPMGDVSFLQNITPYAVSGLMLNFAEHVKSTGKESGTIQAISPGYVIISPAELESGVTELAPVWRIRLDGEDWYINALTGEAVAPE